MAPKKLQLVPRFVMGTATKMLGVYTSQSLVRKHMESSAWVIPLMEMQPVLARSIIVNGTNRNLGTWNQLHQCYFQLNQYVSSGSIWIQYASSGSIWNQLANDIGGEASNDWSGNKVAMSVDGTQAAIVPSL